MQLGLLLSLQRLGYGIGEVVPADFTVTPGADGAYSADTLDPANATNAAGTASTSSSRRYLVATSLNNFTMKTLGSSRDQEITSRASRMEYFLRLTAAGKAYRVFIDSTGINGTTGNIIISLVTGVSESSSGYTVSRTLWEHQNANSITAATFPANAATGYYTVGVSGFDIYIKINGVEIIRIQDFHHCVPGKMAIRSTAGYTQLAPTFTFNERASLYSIIDDATGSGLFDLRDFGLKSVSTTGSITAGSPTLTVADGSNIRVGDYVCVVIGNEAGAGARGTIGVGGVWPAKYYADLTAMNADTTQANNTYAWRQDTGAVYRWATGSPGSWTAVAVTQWYTYKSAPRSLYARVTAKPSTNVCTLDTNATVDATNATVKVDMSAVFNRLGQIYTNAQYSTAQINTDFNPAAMTIYVPDGDYPCVGYIVLPSTGYANLVGAGKTTTFIRSVEGLAPAAIRITSSNSYVSGIHLIGTAWNSKYGLGWGNSKGRMKGYDLSGLFSLEEPYSVGVTETAITTGPAFPHGIIIVQNSNSYICNVNVTDVWQQAIACTFSTDSRAYDSAIYMTQPIRQYIQWLLHWADHTGTAGVKSVYNITVDSPYLTGAFEMFKCRNTWFDNITTRNGTCANNGSEDSKYSNITITIEQNTQYIGEEGAASSSNNPIFNINNNIGVAANLVDGGIIIDGFSVVQDFINPSNDLMSVVVISGQTPNCQVMNGTIRCKDFVPGGRTGFVALASNGANADFSNIDIYGKSVNQVNGSGNKAIVHAANSTAASGSTDTNLRTFTYAGTAITPVDETAPA